MADTQWLTQAQYDKLQAELTDRVEVRRPEIARLIDAARQEGDLRENGGYHAARNEQSLNETRIQALEEMLRNAEVGETPADDGIVEPGMVVTALVAGREQKFLLGSRDAGGDLGVQVFSSQAPLGAAVMGHRKGDTLTYEAPNGREITVESEQGAFSFTQHHAPLSSSSVSALCSISSATRVPTLSPGSAVPAVTMRSLSSSLTA